MCYYLFWRFRSESTSLSFCGYAFFAYVANKAACLQAFHVEDNLWRSHWLKLLGWLATFYLHLSLNCRDVGAPKMTSQPVSSFFSGWNCLADQQPFIFTYPLTARVIGASKMTTQPVSFFFSGNQKPSIGLGSTTLLQPAFLMGSLLNFPREKLSCLG